MMTVPRTVWRVRRTVSCTVRAAVVASSAEPMSAIRKWRTIMADEISTAPAVADPAPLGLAAFALTTFLLSAINAGWAKNTTGGDWWGYAIAYGGLGPLLARMWGCRHRNVFGATAFSAYGGFWIGLGLWLHFVAPTATHPIQINRDLGWILLAFAIFNV